MIEKVLDIFGYQKKPARTRTRNYNAALQQNFNFSWAAHNLSADQILKYDLRTLRAKSRELERNNDYMKRFIRMVKSNVVGPQGIRLQSKVMNSSSRPDEVANLKIEEAWRAWTKRGVCEVTGKLSFLDVSNMVMSHIVRDGEVLVRYIYEDFNPFQFSLQLIEADHLDERLNENLPNGNTIKMGVEANKYGRPVAYHLFTQHPGDRHYTNYQRVRIPADQILHIYTPTRISASRGIPWAHTAMIRLNSLGGYEEAELVAARVGAMQLGFYKNIGQEEFTGETDSAGQPIKNLEPGTFEMLPPGTEIDTFKPEHPTTAFDHFIRATLRGIAAGLDVDYNTLANDLENVNYSSIRAGLLDTRDIWRTLQTWDIQHFIQPVYDRWLLMGLMNKAINLPLERYEKFNAAKWLTRGWAWVDPRKDIEAEEKAIDLKLKSRTEAAAEQGRDFEEILQEQQREKELMKKYGQAETAETQPSQQNED